MSSTNPTDKAKTIEEVFCFGFEDPTFINDIHVLVGKDKIETAKAQLESIMQDHAIDAQKRVTRFEVIDHRECVWCRGRRAARYLQDDGSYKEQPCDKCGGSGMMGGRVYAVRSNPERSMIEIDLSYQDDGRTLKVFVKDKQLRTTNQTLKGASDE